MRVMILTVWAAAAIMVLGALGVAAGTELPDRPLDLEDCVALARQHNPSLTVAHEGVMSARAELKRAVSSYYPTAAFVATHGWTGGSSFVETATGAVSISAEEVIRDSEVVLSQTLWATGRRESVRGARESLLSSDANEQSVTQDLVLSVSRLYYQALAAAQLVEVANAQVAAARDHEKLVRARAEVGEASPVDIAPAEADVAGSEFSLLQVANDAAVAKAQLKREMGVPPTYELRLTEPSPEDYEESLPTLGDAFAVAIENRPEVASAKHSVAAAEQWLSAAKVRKWGDVAVTARYQEGISGTREGKSWSALLGITAVLFDPGQREANVESARASRNMLRAQEQEVVNAIGLEVEAALLTAETARESVGTAEKEVVSAEAQLAAATGKYREGVGIFVEILDAQESLARARTNNVRAIYEYRIALVALQRAMALLVPGTEVES